MVDSEGECDSVEDDIGDIGGVLDGGEGGQDGVGAHNGAIERPVNEAVVGGGGDAEVHDVAIVVGAVAGDGAAVGCHNINLDGVLAEGDAVEGVAFNDDGARVEGDVVVPLDKVIVVVGRGNHEHGGAVGIASVAEEATADDGRCESHRVGVGNEVGRDHDSVTLVENHGAGVEGGIHAVAPTEEYMV